VAVCAVAAFMRTLGVDGPSWTMTLGTWYRARKREWRRGKIIHLA
jgi:hypothetical protein